MKKPFAGPASRILVLIAAMALPVLVGACGPSHSSSYAYARPHYGLERTAIRRDRDRIGFERARIEEHHDRIIGERAAIARYRNRIGRRPPR